MTVFFVQKSSNPVLTAVGVRLHELATSDPDVLSLDLDVHMDKVLAGDYVFLSDSVSAEAFTRQDCQLDHVVDHDSVGTPYTVNLPRGSAFTRLFDE